MSQPNPVALAPNPYFLMDGRIYNEDGSPYPTDRVFADAWDADLFLMTDPEAAFGSAHIAGAINL
jgi:hypothetical protein